MKITFDPNIKLAGVAVVPWNRLGPEQYLPDYAIASYYDWDVNDRAGLPPLAALVKQSTVLPELEKLNTAHLFADRAFQQMLDSRLPGYDLLTYRPVQVPPALANRKILAVDEHFTEQFENKVKFRRRFNGQLPFPPYDIYDRDELAPTEQSFEAVVGTSGKIIQDELLSGGKGSFIVRNLEQYQRALQELQRLSGHHQVVVSDLIESAREYSIQACVTKAGTVTGPLQRQVIAHPLLSNKAVADGDKFCGGQILASDQGSPIHKQAAGIAEQIGEVLASEGYRGIFGVDFLLDQKSNLYVLEINPRITGLTPLLTALFKRDEGVPFYLLHILELGGYDYEITDPTRQFDQTGALLMMHALETSPVEIVSSPSSGTYTVQDGELVGVSSSIDMRQLRPREFIIQEYMAPGMRIKPGGRLISLQFREQILDENTDELYNTTLETITAIQRKVKLKPVS